MELTREVGGRAVEGEGGAVDPDMAKVKGYQGVLRGGESSGGIVYGGLELEERARARGRALLAAVAHYPLTLKLQVSLKLNPNDLPFPLITRSFPLGYRLFLPRIFFSLVVFVLFLVSYHPLFFPRSSSRCKLGLFFFSSVFFS